MNAHLNKEFETLDAQLKALLVRMIEGNEPLKAQVFVADARLLLCNAQGLVELAGI